MALNLKFITFSCFIFFSLPLNEGLSCNRIASCKCRMSDGSGDINLASLASKNGIPAYTVRDDIGNYWSYQYNPCVPFISGPYTDLAILQIAMGNPSDQYNLGVQKSETFTYSSASGVSIKYQDDPNFHFRNSSVLLICNSAANEHRLEFLGELISTEYEFILNGPCACPGKCDDFGIIVPTTTTTTKPTTTTTTQSGQPVEPSFNWNHLGNVIAGLIFHDFILVFIIAAVLIGARLICNFDICSAGQNAPKQFSEA